MSNMQPLPVQDNSEFQHPASLDGLDQVFAADVDVAEAQPAVEAFGPAAPVTQEMPELMPVDAEAAAQIVDEAMQSGTRELPRDLFTRQLDEFDTLSDVRPVKPTIKKPRSPRNTGSFNAFAPRNQAQPAPKGRPENQSQPEIGGVPARSSVNSGASEEMLRETIVDADDRVSRQDLLNILDGFARILRRDESSADFSPNSSQNSRLNISRVQAEELCYHDIQVEDKSAELEEMRRLVIEAQETIIKLLTDRVEDRARIATLETEVRLLPDLQDQADRAMAVAFKTEEFRTELHRVKYELERYRFANVRARAERGPRFWFTRVRRWFLKAKGMNLRNYDDERKRLSSD